MGLTVIIELVSLQIGLNWNWATGTELGNTIHVYKGKGMIVLVNKNQFCSEDQTIKDIKHTRCYYIEELKNFYIFCASFRTIFPRYKIKKDKTKTHHRRECTTGLEFGTKTYKLKDLMWVTTFTIAFVHGTFVFVIILNHINFLNH